MALLEMLPPAPEPPRTRLAKDRWPVGIVLLTMLAVVLVALWLLTRGDDPVATGATTSAPAQSIGPGGADLRSVDVTEVTASSTLPASGPLSWAPDNLVDLDCATAWNSRRDRGAGESVVFRLEAPVELAAVVVVNGYARDAESFVRNTRVKQLVVVTDGASIEYRLDDSAQPQLLRGDFGRTSQVVLQVASLYPGEKYTEVALTEVAFGAAAAESTTTGTPSGASPAASNLPASSLNCG